MPTVSNVQKSLQTMLIVCLSYCLKRIKKVRGFYAVRKLHGNLGADGGLAKILSQFSDAFVVILVILTPIFRFGWDVRHVRMVL